MYDFGLGVSHKPSGECLVCINAPPKKCDAYFLGQFHLPVMLRTPSMGVRRK